MSGINNPQVYTHFAMTQKELPLEFYAAIGQAFYRWGQLEAVVCAIATSTLSIPWLEAVETLRGKNGFKVKNTFEKLRAEIKKRGGDAQSEDAIGRAENLYIKRNELFHSHWGIVSNETSATVGLQEWSNTSYDNFRPVELSELKDFALECGRVWIDLFRITLPFFHGANSLVIDDTNGLARAVQPDV